MHYLSGVPSMNARRLIPIVRLRECMNSRTIDAMLRRPDGGQEAWVPCW